MSLAVQNMDSNMDFLSIKTRKKKENKAAFTHFFLCVVCAVSGWRARADTSETDG